MYNKNKNDFFPITFFNFKSKNGIAKRICIVNCMFLFFPL